MWLYSLHVLYNVTVFATQDKRPPGWPDGQTRLITQIHMILIWINDIVVASLPDVSHSRAKAGFRLSGINALGLKKKKKKKKKVYPAASISAWKNLPSSQKTCP